jgi:hypothetical protein
MSMPPNAAAVASHSRLSAATVGLAEPHSCVDPIRVLASFDLVRELAAAQLRAFVEES